MPDINNAKMSFTAEQPYIDFTVNYTAVRANNTSVNYNFTVSSSLRTTASYVRSGYALKLQITAGGVTSEARIKQNSIDDWEGTVPRTVSLSVTCAESIGNAKQAVRFRTVQDGSYSSNWGEVDNSSYTVNSPELNISVCLPPKIFSVINNPLEALDRSEVEWQGSSGGINNAVNGYEFQHSDSKDGQNWGAWFNTGSIKQFFFIRTDFTVSASFK